MIMFGVVQTILSINFINKVTNVLKQTFSISSEEDETFTYLGLYVQHRKDRENTIQKIPYINELKELQIKKSRKEMSDAQLTEKVAR